VVGAASRGLQLLVLGVQGGSGCGVWGVVVLDVGVDARPGGDEQMAGLAVPGEVSEIAVSSLHPQRPGVKITAGELEVGDVASDRLHVRVCHPGR
jgi:hypothetical protein